ncbi:hypothetical protein CH63R_04654 [Colletotrichum higginsianum IMI 349063]|uniref:Uncharacterized protein n=1 Tax=Colletotrichum higginsianum (strain IMI 349063) TaxID=759273 RepID=A0A1B7YKH1_COLHI|nr:hypothetical protein CH63R_04654 [Colletotrichum higginsianum IMI 349063]OBR12358.1 hypothetical protein CH63R_04654 [Colletotrichum higginsianum IMI 349063]
MTCGTYGQQQLPSIPTATAVHEVNYRGVITAERRHPDKRGSSNTPNEANPAVYAAISVKLEEPSPIPYLPPREVESPGHSSLLVTVAKGPTLSNASSQRESGTLPSNSHSDITPESQSNSRFDRNEAWDIPEDRKFGMHRSLFSPQVLSPIERQRGRPSTTRVEKMKLENYKALAIPATRNLSLRKNIRDGFAKDETFLSGSQHSVKRRRRSPPPPGIGPLSVSFGPKPAITRKIKKRTGVRESFIIDPDLDPDSKKQEQPEGFNVPHNAPIASDCAGQSYHHILPSIEKSTTDNDVREPLVLPSLRTHDSF